MLSKMVLLSVLSLGIHGLALAQNTQDASPSLNETERWINQTFTDDNVGKIDCEEYSPAGSLAAPVYTRCFGTRYELNLNGCNADLWLFPWKSEDLKDGLRKEDIKADVLVLRFRLGAIDPTTIKVGETVLLFGNKQTWHDNPPSYREVAFSTTDSADAITLEFLQSHDQYKEHDCCNLLEPGIAANPEYAPRFAKAFRHAVELCGGKSSAF